ncbi:MAG: hypothetical protein ACK412_00275 [Chloroherpetonaceae bacterium]
MQFLPLLFVFFICACGTTKQDVQKQDARPFAKLPQQIPPNHCRIVGTISLIDSTRFPDPQSPCAKAPCKAKVKINKILGYGSGFTNPLTEGREVEMTFAFTLAPTTKELFPNLDARYKGLKQGDTFQADVELQQRLGDSAASFVVMSYEVK